MERTTISAEETPRSFPAPHVDVMEQAIDYRVPVELYDDLAAYDGSVIVERTRGEMSARCDLEAANFLALNLADEIVRGPRTVEDARAEYGRQIMAFKAGRASPTRAASCSRRRRPAATRTRHCARRAQAGNPVRSMNC